MKKRKSLATRLALAVYAKTGNAEKAMAVFRTYGGSVAS